LGFEWTDKQYKTIRSVTDVEKPSSYCIHWLLD
jgi:hypothetical protein